MFRVISDIQYGGTNEDFVWRSDTEDFETGSKLTVGESQEALFYFNGECVGVLGAGGHVLETEHVPFLRKLFNKVTGNANIFHAVIYFVNKVELDMRWGVGDIVYEDPMGPVFNIGCHGQMNLMADNSRKIVEKLVGNQRTLTKDMLVERFRELMTAEVKDVLVNTLMGQQVSITRVAAHQKTISQALEPILYELFLDYGFSLRQFKLGNIMVPEDDPEYRRLKGILADQGLQARELQLKAQRDLAYAQLEAQKQRMAADAMAYSRGVQGYDYATQRQFEILEKFADQSGEGGGASGISGDFMKLGAGLGMMGAVGGMVQNMAGPYLNGMGAMWPGMNPYGQAGANPYGQAGANPYGQPGMNPYAQPGMNPYGQAGANPYGQPGVNPYAQPGANSYGQPWGNPNPYMQGMNPNGAGMPAPEGASVNAAAAEKKETEEKQQKEQEESGDEK